MTLTGNIIVWTWTTFFYHIIFIESPHANTFASSALAFTEGRLYHRPQTQWVQIPKIPRTSRQLSQDLGNAQWKESCDSFNKNYRKEANPVIVRMRVNGHGCGLKFKLVTVICELVDDWYQKPPAFYMYEICNSNAAHAFPGYLIVRGRTPILSLEGHLSFIAGSPMQMGVQFSSIYPHRMDVGVVTLAASATVNELRQAVREQLKLPLSMELNLYASKGEFMHRAVDAAPAHVYFEFRGPVTNKRNCLAICDRQEDHVEPRKKSRRRFAQILRSADSGVVITID